MVTETRRKTATAKPTAPADLDDEGIARRCAAVCEDRKAVDVRLYDVRGNSLLTDFYLVCSGNSEPHLQAICTHIEDEMRRFGRRPAHVDGTAASRWIVIDFGIVIVHVFHPRARDYYAIEKLFGEGRLIHQGNQDETLI